MVDIDDNSEENAPFRKGNGRQLGSSVGDNWAVQLVTEGDHGNVISGLWRIFFCLSDLKLPRPIVQNMAHSLLSFS